MADAIDELPEDDDDDVAEFDEDDYEWEDPTKRAYDELATAFEYFNSHLFDFALPTCLITLQRRRSTYGYFSPDRFGSTDGSKVDEIALNPMKWRHRPVEDNLSTLVHEMVHLWQHHHGKPSRAGYHNTEWSQKMQAVGLIPSSDGKPGGLKTGQSVSHYIEPGGLFEDWCAKFLATGPTLSFHDLTDEREGTERKNKTKYKCADCGGILWGKPNFHPACTDCHLVPGQPIMTECL